MNGGQRYKNRTLRQLVRINVESSFSRFNTNENSFWKKFFVDLCNNLSFHGLNHFVDDERPVLEKIFWGCLLFGAFCGAITSVRQIWLHYMRSSTETVVETTYYKYSQIAFPAVVICEASRVDWKRVLELNQSMVAEYSEETKPAIIALLRILAGIDFGEFDEFENLIPYKNVFEKLKTLRISELLLKVSRNCEEIFVGKCWWRSHEIDCCLLFERQKTEFGYCYSFNSDLSEYSKKLSVVKDGINSYWRDPDGVLRPRRTGSRGQWSGLRVSVNTPPVSQLPPGTAIKPGMTVLVGEPRSFVMGGEITIGAGQYGNVHIWGDRIHSTERLRDLDLNKRQCLYSDEAEALGLPYYTRQNCKVDCHKYHTFKYCNCTPDFMFFESNENNPTYPPCTVQDLLCLNKYNSIFNNLLPNFAHSFFGENETGMFCDCKADCNHQMYIAEVTVADESNSSQEVLLDIHFRQSTCILYRSDVMIGMLDLLVMFGGCTGLFLGGSLLSCVELIYFVTLRLYFQWKNWRNTNLAVDVETPSSEKSTNN